MSERQDALIRYPGHEILLPDIVRAENCHLFDAAGRRYVDLESGVWCATVGHGHPRVLRALTEQAARIAHNGYCYSTAVVEEAARELLALMGFEGGDCALLCSGSEAVEHGVRTAQAASERPLLMTMADSYFGAYGSASRRRADEWFSFDWTPCASCPFAGECDRGCPHWAAVPFERIGGFLFEPGSSSGLVRFPPDKLIRNLVAAIRRDGGLVLVNEVTTGFGRTGRWFGHQHYGFAPDIVATGKSLGNGYPVSAALYAPGVRERLGGRPVKYAQSHQNDPLGAAVAREVVRVIVDEDLIARGAAVGARLLDGLETIRAGTGGIAEVRARGSMIAVELQDGPEAATTTRVHRGLVDRGYVTGRRPGLSVLRIDPALTIGMEDVDGFLAAFAAVLGEV